MPADFLRCVKKSNHIITKKLSGGKYIKICYLNGKSYAGEVHTKKDAKPSSWIKKAYNKK